MFAAGYRYRVDFPLPGTRRRADIAFPGKRVAIFVDGCFWHVCPDHITWPKTNAAWWRSKLEGNQRRDRETDRMLTEAGWTVVRLWEHDDPQLALDRMRALHLPRTETQSRLGSSSFGNR